MFETPVVNGGMDAGCETGLDVVLRESSLDILGPGVGQDQFFDAELGFVEDALVKGLGNADVSGQSLPKVGHLVLLHVNGLGGVTS